MALIFKPFVIPMILAAFASFAVEGILTKVFSPSRRKRYFALTLMMCLVIFVLLPSTLVAIRFFGMLKGLSATSIRDSHFIHSVFELWDIVSHTVEGLMVLLGVDSQALASREELIARLIPVIVEGAKNVLNALPHFGLSLFIFFSALILFTTNAEGIKRTVVGSRILPLNEIEHITQLLKSSCFLITISLLVIGGIQALIVSLGARRTVEP